MNPQDIYAEFKNLGLGNGLMLVLYFHFVVFPLISNAVTYIRATAARVGVQPTDLALQAGHSGPEQDLFVALAKAAVGAAAGGGLATALSAASNAAPAAQGAAK